MRLFGTAARGFWRKGILVVLQDQFAIAHAVEGTRLGDAVQLLLRVEVCQSEPQECDWFIP